jgi:hypothetical protein
MIDPAHPVWRDFPTDSYTDWQWWELTSRSFAVDMDAISARPAMPFRFVDKYNRNALPAAIFEAKVGTGRLLVCTLDITTDLDQRIAARQLRRSVVAYLKSDRFRPQTELTESQLQSLFVTTSAPNVARGKVSVSSAHDEYPAHLAVDGDPKTFWHSDWMIGDGLPATFTLELPETALLRGFRYMPRQDMNRGRIADYSVEVSQDGQKWQAWVKDGRFPDTADTQAVTFAQPVKAKFLRLTARSDHGAAHHAAIAEMEVNSEEISADVRDLGIVPGFNDPK